MRIAREGYPLIFTALILTLLAFLAGWMALGIILGLIGIAIAGFFVIPSARRPWVKVWWFRRRMVKWSVSQGQR